VLSVVLLQIIVMARKNNSLQEISKELQQIEKRHAKDTACLIRCSQMLTTRTGYAGLHCPTILIKMGYNLPVNGAALDVYIVNFTRLRASGPP
jgi:hypothetical protein